MKGSEVEKTLHLTLSARKRKNLPEDRESFSFLSPLWQRPFSVMGDFGFMICREYR